MYLCGEKYYSITDKIIDDRSDRFDRLTGNADGIETRIAGGVFRRLVLKADVRPLLLPQSLCPIRQP